jgi:DNA-binding transcriptional MerR regulator
MEIMHDNPTDDPTEWQRPGDLSELLGISERSLRQWAKDGKAEKSRLPGGSVYYRIPEGMEAAGTPEAAVPEVGKVLALVETMTANYEERLEQLRDRITSEAVAAAEARVLADVAVRDLEAARGVNVVAQEELAQLRANLARERARADMMERAATLPWWAWGKRRQLQTALVAGLLEG